MKGACRVYNAFITLYYYTDGIFDVLIIMDVAAKKLKDLKKWMLQTNFQPNITEHLFNGNSFRWASKISVINSESNQM